MDSLDHLLHGAQARGALFNQTILEPPWSLRIADAAPLALFTMVSGHGWVVPDHGDPRELRTGDMAIVRGPAHYTVSDDPETSPQIVVHQGGRATTPDGVDLGAESKLGLRTCGVHLDGSAVIVSGTYQVQGDVSQRLLMALPPLLVVPERDVRGPLMKLVLAEISKDEPGQQAVLDRLLDLVLIATLRAWFARPEANAPGWYQALSDPVVGQALRLVHDDVTRSWTVADLAARVGASRAAFARRFTDLVGEPPMSYVSSWRVALAGDMLRETDFSLESIARQVGYSNAFALSTAFKRLRGVSPSHYREHSSLVTKSVLKAQIS